MKRILFITLLVSSLNVFSQTSNLTELASGKLERFYPITELDNNVYGYLAIYKLDEINSESSKLEYIIFDKNLNKISEGVFVDVYNKKLKSKFYYPIKLGDKIVIPVKNNFYPRLPYLQQTSYRYVDLKNNELSNPFYFNTKDEKFEYGKIKIDKKLHKKSLKEKFSVTDNDFIKAKGGFILNEYIYNPLVGKFPVLKPYILAFDNDRNKKWKYYYNKENKRAKNIECLISNKNNIIFSITDYDFSHKIHIVDPLTGKKKFSYEIEKSDSNIEHFFKVSDNEYGVVISGLLKPFKGKINKTKKGFNITVKHSKKINPSKGLFNISIDNKGIPKFKKEFLWNENKHPNLKIDKKGEFNDGYSFLLKQVYHFNDGSIAFLGEKSKNKKDKIKTSDLVLLLFDKEFNLTEVEYFKKDKSKSKYSDYLYSQSIKNGEGVVFFYADYKKDDKTKNKNWILGIVSINGRKIKHETIPISSKKHLILPYIAKEGYILLREFNKDKDYDQIRLERLNY